MGDKSKDDATALPPNPGKALHPVYTVGNIQNKVRVLDGVKVTYSSWVKLFKLHAKGYKVLEHIDGTTPPEKNDPSYEAWVEVDAIVLQWIYGTLSDDILLRVLETDTTARLAWEKIQSIFINNKGSRAAALEYEFTNLTLSACSSMEDYCQKLKDLAEQLKDVDHPVNESRLVLQLVRGLPPEFDTTASFINQSATTWDAARDMLQLEQQRQAARQHTSQSAFVTSRVNNQQIQRRQPTYSPTHHPSNQDSTYQQQPYDGQRQFTNNGPNRGRGRGRYRGGRNNSNRGRNTWSGHHPNGSFRSSPHSYPPWTWWDGPPPPCPYPTQPTERQFPWSRPPPTTSSYATPPTANMTYYSAHTPRGSPPPAPVVDALNPTELGNALHTMHLNPPDHTWYMDSGATSHVTSDPGKISTPLFLSSNSNIFVGNGHKLPITGSGHGYHQTPTHTFHLNDILLAPNIVKNLLSVRKFTRDNFVSIEFDPYGFSLKDLKTGRILSRHNSSSDLYPFTSEPLCTPTCLLTSSQSNWHNRLGHPGAQVLDFLSSRSLISCNKTRNSGLCHSCQISNSKRLPFFESTSVTFAPFDIIHCDLWTSPIQSKTGYKYYMVLIDNHTQYVWVYPLKFKSETFTTFVKFHKLIHTQFNKNIKAFQCDLGGEFDNHEFKNFAHTHGLVFRFSCPQTSSQNGKAERMIRRLNDIVRALLLHANLPPSFWVEALHTSAYLHNILPTKRLNFHTPTYALFRRNPSYDHLRVFGCACYPNMSATQPHKLHSRSSLCIFLGYPSNFREYRCFDPHTGKVHISRHVLFDETNFPSSGSISPDLYQFLDDDQPNPIMFPFHMSPPTGPNNTNPLTNTLPTSTSPTVPTSPAPPHLSATNQSSSQPAASHPTLPSQTEQLPIPDNTHHMTTRSKIGILKPNPKYTLYTSPSNDISPLPSTYTKAISDPNWHKAMLNEFKALKDNGTWELVPRPPDHPVIRCIWLFRHKFKSDGTLERYKARLVVNGKSQTVGIDCMDTFSPVVKPATIRTVLSISLSKSWPIHQLDVKNAFLHGHLNETVYMHQPPGFVDQTAPNHVCRLRRSLYGLKQAPRAWFTRFYTFITTHGFKSSVCDNSLFIYKHGNDIAYLLLYVDDIVLTASTTTLLTRTIDLLSHEFAMTNLGPLHYFLGITVTRDTHGLFLSQKQYAKDILHRANMSNCKPCATPVDTSSKLSANDGPLLVDGSLYRSLAGALQYLTFTRPDISYAVQQICLFMHAPREPHFNFMKRILRYIKGTTDFGLRLHPSPGTSLTAYSDADWGGCPDSRRSTSGYCVYLGDNLISWSSKRQPTISRSSAEAEYRGVANAVAETSWLRNLLLELHIPLRRATIVYCDNVSAVYLSENPVHHQRTKHVEIDIHFVREKVRLGHIRVLHVPAAYQYADIFTKGLPRQLFQNFRSSLSVRLPPAHTAGAY